tara:strand:+ start:4242 stop:5342 length:1101 start_codon:yes stop_codon:yes gene_type:complete
MAKAPKVSVHATNSRLYLNSRGWPRKDGTEGTQQAKLPLYLDDTPANRKLAERRAVVVRRALEDGLFQWSDWLEQSNAPTWKAGIDALYKKRVINGRTSENTWRTQYAYLRQTKPTTLITQASVRKALQRYDRKQAAYKEFFYLLKDMCQLVNVPWPEMPVPTYHLGTVKDVPSDEEIVDWVLAAPPEASWAFGMLACYGLRPHELDGCQFIDDRHRLQVPDDSKTGFRIVTTPRPDWVDLFDLRNERRMLHKSTSAARTSNWLHGQKKKLGIRWTPYALRHAFAAALWRVGGSEMDLFTAARLMGHTVAEHEKTYRAHIHPHTIATAAEDAFARNLAKQRQVLLSHDRAGFPSREPAQPADASAL